MKDLSCVSIKDEIENFDKIPTNDLYVDISSVFNIFWRGSYIGRFCVENMYVENLELHNRTIKFSLREV